MLIPARLKAADECGCGAEEGGERDAHFFIMNAFCGMNSFPSVSRFAQTR